MPIRPENRALYPTNWKAIALAVKAAADWTCQTCGLRHGEPNRVTGARVVLTVAHLDHDPRNCASANLKALCDTCHNRYDLRHRQANAAVTRRSRKAAGDLFDGAP